MCPDDELQAPARRLEAARAALRRAAMQRLYIDHVLQADQGADLDFLVGKSGAAVAREFALRSAIAAAQAARSSGAPSGS